MTTKTSEAQRRATEKWRKKAYKRYDVNLRYDTDGKLIEAMEKARTSCGVTEFVRQALKEFLQI